MAGGGLAAGLPLLLLAMTTLEAAPMAAAAATETETLLTFRKALLGPTATGPPAPLDQWTTTPGPCLVPGKPSTWFAVRCHPSSARVLGLRLEYLGLQGPPPDLTPLSSLTGLRALSFANNNLTGAFPSSVSALPALKMLYLSRNRLSGAVPDDAFAHMRGLRKLYLNDNGFTGTVPASVNTSPKLLALQLARNRFEGPLPEMDRPRDLQTLDVSFNDLSGPVPERLRKFGAPAFQGNKGMCGPPLVDAPCPPGLEDGGSPSSSSGSLKILMIIAIAVVALGGLLAIVGIITALLARRNNDDKNAATETAGAGTAVAAKLQTTSESSIKVEQRDMEEHGTVVAVSVKRSRRDENPAGKLVFIQDDESRRVVRFELEDLLRASAEVLGSGTFGASYKATFLDGTAVVVKRFKEMNGAGRRADFSEHMRRLGRLTHPNLHPVVAYMYKKEEKLFVTEHVGNGGLAQILHGGASATSLRLDWAARLGIVKGVARALAYLYDELPMLTVPHGHLKSSNVLLGDDLQPLLTDYSLVPVVTPHHASQVMVAYKAPECGAAQGGKASRKSDVWSLGILILEVLTGKFPANYLRQGREGSTDLAGWVNSVVREEWTGEVFDAEMRGARGAEGEMVKLLKVGLCCCDQDVAARWDVKEALARIEEVRDRDPGGGDDSSTASSYLSDGATEPHSAHST